MTTPTLTDILAKLKAEPEWRTGYQHVFVHLLQSDATLSDDFHDFGSANKVRDAHNATRARLLAVVDELDYVIQAFNSAVYHPGEWLSNKLTIDHITAKLAAALEGEK